MSSLFVPNFDSAPFSMPKLQPVNHFSQVNSLDPGLNYLSRVCVAILQLLILKILYKAFLTSPSEASRISNRCKVSRGHIGHQIFRKWRSANKTRQLLYFLYVAISNLLPSITRITAAIHVHSSIQAIKLFPSGIRRYYADYFWFYGLKNRT